VIIAASLLVEYGTEVICVVCAVAVVIELIAVWRE